MAFGDDMESVYNELPGMVNGKLYIEPKTDFSEAAAFLTRSLEIFREFNAHNATAVALLSLGRLRQATGEHDQSESLFNECLHIARQLQSH